MNRGPVVFTAILFLCSVVRADVFVSTSITLSQLTITPASGTFQIISSPDAYAFAQAYDSTGGYAANYDDESGTAATNAATSLANASATASATALTASASSGVTLPGVNASAGTSIGPYGQLGFFSPGSFEISANAATPVPVNVTFSALLQAAQSLTTTAFGVSANSEVTFNLQVIDPVNGAESFLFFDNPLGIGPASTLASSSTPTLTDTETLQTNTPYGLIIDVDAESSGVDATPEPGYFWLVAGGLSVLSIFAARRRLRRG